MKNCFCVMQKFSGIFPAIQNAKKMLLYKLHISQCTKYYNQIILQILFEGSKDIRIIIQG